MSRCSPNASVQGPKSTGKQGAFTASEVNGYEQLNDVESCFGILFNLKWRFAKSYPA